MIHHLRTPLIRIALILGVLGMLVYAFDVRGALGGSTFATNDGQGGLELKVDSTTYYNGVYQPGMSWALKNLTPGVDKFFNFSDVKPGDYGTSSISLHLKKNPAYMCLDFVNLIDKENGINEPESHVDTTPNDGELADGLEFFAWLDDGDRTFEVGEKPLFGTSTQSGTQVLASTTYVLADVTTGTPFKKDKTYYVGVYWCAGDLTVDVTTAKFTCDGTVLGNEAQTDSMSIDVVLRAVSSASKPTFTCLPPPPEQCEIEGHKYDYTGKPLANWKMGLMKIITHNRGTDIYDLATDVTDENGYYCLNWDGEQRTLRGKSTYVNGPYTYVYHVFEMMQPGYKFDSSEKGPHYNLLNPVPNGDIRYDGSYVSVSLGSGYIIKNAAYHVDFYNKLKTATTTKKGNNGHGNDEDKNDNSNPGNSNDPNDDTDDDGLPPGFVKKQTSLVPTLWQQTPSTNSAWQGAKKWFKKLRS